MKRRVSKEIKTLEVERTIKKFQDGMVLLSSPILWTLKNDKL